MRYEFENVKISREKRYSLGKETTTNKYYLSFPVSPPNQRYVEGNPPKLKTPNK